MDQEEITKIISTNLKLDYPSSAKLLEKAELGGEINGEITPEFWLKNRLLPNIVFINEEEYAHMCIDALKILGNTAATDFGGSRQRDLGQLWADMTRGYLGEMAVVKFLESRWGIKSKLGHELGQLSDYLPMDIHQIRKKGEEYRSPKTGIGVKAIKINGIWLDIPGQQFEHSDFHILVKVATGRDHLFAFFKSLSVFKDKVLKRGEQIGALSHEESETLFEKLPNFSTIPAYICGFAKREGPYDNLSYQGRKGRTRYLITGWKGPVEPGDLEKIGQTENVPVEKIMFEGIGSFAHDKGYLFNSGNLLWKDNDWVDLIDSL